MGPLSSGSTEHLAKIILHSPISWQARMWCWCWAFGRRNSHHYGWPSPLGKDRPYLSSQLDKREPLAALITTSSVVCQSVIACSGWSLLGNIGSVEKEADRRITWSGYFWFALAHMEAGSCQPAVWDGDKMKAIVSSCHVWLYHDVLHAVEYVGRDGVLQR